MERQRWFRLRNYVLLGYWWIPCNMYWFNTCQKCLLSWNLVLFLESGCLQYIKSIPTRPSSNPMSIYPLIIYLSNLLCIKRHISINRNPCAVTLRFYVDLACIRRIEGIKDYRLLPQCHVKPRQIYYGTSHMTAKHASFMSFSRLYNENIEPKEFHWQYSVSRTGKSQHNSGGNLHRSWAEFRV
jgi:hypothetical protein